MLELLRTTDPVLLSFVESLLKGCGIEYFVADQHIRAAEGSVDAFPRRILILAEDHMHARRTLEEAGLKDELPPIRREAQSQ